MRTNKLHPFRFNSDFYGLQVLLCPFMCFYSTFFFFFPFCVCLFCCFFLFISPVCCNQKGGKSRFWYWQNTNTTVKELKSKWVCNKIRIEWWKLTKNSFLFETRREIIARRFYFYRNISTKPNYSIDINDMKLIVYATKNTHTYSIHGLRVDKTLDCFQLFWFTRRVFNTCTFPHLTLFDMVVAVFFLFFAIQFNNR